MTDLRQRHYRFRTDALAVDGTPTWGAAEDTDYDPGANNFRLRIGVTNALSSATGSIPWQIYSSKNGGAYAAVTTASTGGVRSVDASSDSDDAIITIPRLSLAPIAAPATTFDPDTLPDGNIVLSNGDLTATVVIDAYRGARTIVAIPAASKKYWSNYIDSVTFNCGVGLCNESFNLVGSVANVNNAGYGSGVGSFYSANNLISDALMTYGASDRIDIAVDVSAKLIWFRKNNGNWNNDAGADPSGGVGGLSFSTLSATSYYAMVVLDYATITSQFSSGSWTNPAPSGFTQLDA